MMRQTSLRLMSLVLVAVSGIAACAGPDAAVKNGEAGIGGGAIRLADDSFDPSGLTRGSLDLNKDGRPDAYQFIQPDPSGGGRVLRKEVDVNFDGKIDVIRTMDDKGELVEERIDGDFDGKIDVVIAFQKGVIVKKTYDTNFDGKADLWRFFDKGAIVREEADLDYNQAVDMWEYYEAGVLDRIGVDRDGDGNVDDWQSRDAT
jgi:hypothetical protein